MRYNPVTAICAITEDSRLNTAQTIDQFLSAIEKRAYRMAVIATSNRDDALEIVQEAMIKLVTRYGNKDAEHWGPLFHRILQSTIRDWYRRSKVRNGLRHFFFGNTDEKENDPMDEFADPAQTEPDQQLKEQQAMQALDAALHNLPLR
ncbi:MAG: RNA polymerase sigma factor, partial [Gammaproteobacteria bacterium]|nr:RNA polymerase sigma factor [Gammaproteobacteria bacterium]